MTTSPLPEAHLRTADANPLSDTAAVAQMMRALDQQVRTTPCADVPDAERLLRARLVLEEALELVDALGFTTGLDDAGNVAVLTPSGGPAPADLVECADALADLTVVVKGTGHTMGIPVDAAFDVVHATNMAKVGPDGKVTRRDDGKVLKPAGWQPPTEGLRALVQQR